MNVDEAKFVFTAVLFCGFAKATLSHDVETSRDDLHETYCKSS